MSERAISWAQEQTAPTGTAKFLLMRLAAYADAEGVVWAYVERLAKEMQTSDRTVQRSLRALCNAGLLELTGRFRYRNVPYYSLPIERAEAARTVTPVSPLAQANGDTSVTIENANGDTGVTPTVTPVSPQSREPSSSEGEPSSPGGRAGETSNFREAWDGYPEAGRRGRSSPKLGRMAWDVAVGQGHATADLAFACRGYAADRAAWGASGAPVAFHRFLSEGRFEGYLPKAGETAGGSAACRTAFAGPPEMRAAFVAVHGEASAVSWLDQTAWCVPLNWGNATEPCGPGQLEARSEFAAARLRELLARVSGWSAVKVTGPIVVAEAE